jgi:hypothetical protein
MPTEQELIQSLGDIARSWRQKKSHDLEAQYTKYLNELYKMGWDYALGEDGELLDEQMPARYLQRRDEIIDSLESELGRLAMKFRGAQDGSEEEAETIRHYHRTMEELFRIGHWHGEPEWDAQLPDQLMPQVYHDFWS